MRGTKETLGGMKEGTKSKGRTVSKTTTGKGVKPTGKTGGHIEGEHGGLKGRKTSARKGVTGK